MKRLACIICALLLSSAVSLWGQHGTAESGYYPLNYNGDTWTGFVTRANDETREITLTFAKGDKTEHFTCVIQSGYKVTLKDGAAKELRPSDFPLGTRAKVYYMRKVREDAGGKVDYYEAFEVRPLPDEGKSIVGVLADADDTRREITLTNTPDGKPFVGTVIAGLHVRAGDKGYQELRVSDLPKGAQLMVNYHTDTRKTNGKKEEFFRIHRIRLVTKP